MQHMQNIKPEAWHISVIPSFWLAVRTPSTLSCRERQQASILLSLFVHSTISLSSNTHTHTHTHTYIYIYTYIHIYIYIYIYIYSTVNMYIKWGIIRWWPCIWDFLGTPNFKYMILSTENKLQLLVRGTYFLSFSDGAELEALLWVCDLGHSRRQSDSRTGPSLWQVGLSWFAKRQKTQL